MLSFKEHRTSIPEAVGKLLAGSKRTLDKRSDMAPMAFVTNLTHAFRGGSHISPPVAREPPVFPKTGCEGVRV